MLDRAPFESVFLPTKATQVVRLLLHLIVLQAQLDSSRSVSTSCELKKRFADDGMFRNGFITNSQTSKDITRLESESEIMLSAEMVQHDRRKGKKDARG